MNEEQPLDPAVERFIDRLGHEFELDGLTRIAGRIFAWLLLTTEPKSLEDIATALQVSKGSASQDTRLLERVGALERVTRPGDRRVYYQVGDYLNERMMELRLERVRRTQETLRLGLATPPAHDPAVAERLEMVVSFFDHMKEALTSSRAAWVRERDAAQVAVEEKSNGRE